jgi:hypothetical protein
LNLVVAVVDEERYAGHAAVNRAEALVAGRRVRGVAVGLAGAAIERVPAWLHGDIGLLELEIDGAWDMADDVRPKNFFLRETGGVYTPTVKTIIKKKNTVQYKANTEAKQDKEV